MKRAVEIIIICAIIFFSLIIFLCIEFVLSRIIDRAIMLFGVCSIIAASMSFLLVAGGILLWRKRSQREHVQNTDALTKEKNITPKASDQIAMELLHINVLERFLLENHITLEQQIIYMQYLSIDLNCKYFLLADIYNTANNFEKEDFLNATDSNKIVQCAKAIKFIQKSASENQCNVAIGHMRNSCILLFGTVFHSDPLLMVQSCSKIFDQFLKNYVETNKISVRITIGRAFNSITSPQTMYQELIQMHTFADFINLSSPILSAEQFWHITPTLLSQVQKEHIEALFYVRKGMFIEARKSIDSLIEIQFQPNIITPAMLRMTNQRIFMDMVRACDEFLLKTGKRVEQEKFLLQLEDLHSKQDLKQLLFSILDETQEISKIQGNTSSVWVNMAVKYIEQNYTDPEFNATALADYLGKSLSHVSRTFRSEFGYGPSEYIQRYRCDAVYPLLKKGLKLSEIAEQAGFTSVSSMNRAFKKYNGILPGLQNTV